MLCILITCVSILYPKPQLNRILRLVIEASTIQYKSTDKNLLPSVWVICTLECENRHEHLALLSASVGIQRAPSKCNKLRAFASRSPFLEFDFLNCKNIPTSVDRLSPRILERIVIVRYCVTWLEKATYVFLVWFWEQCIKVLYIYTVEAG